MNPASASDRQPLFKLDGTPVYGSAKTFPGLIGLLIGAHIAAHLSRPQWTGTARLILTLIWWIAFIAADTAHSVGHIRSARLIGAPMDELDLMWGIQLNGYHNHDVPPRQHIGRASGGVLASAGMTTVALIADSILHQIPILSAISEAWLFSNAIIFGGALIPTPHFDAWSILKWAIVQQTGDEAHGESIANLVGALTTGIAALAAWSLITRGKWRSALLAIATVGLAGADRFMLKGRL